MNGFLRLAISLVVILVSVACAVPPTPPQNQATPLPTAVKAETPFEFTVAVGADTISLHPFDFSDAPSKAIMWNMYQRLVGTEPDGTPVPMLAESWKVIDDKTYQFKLRSGVKFHNGKTLNADDVVASIKEILKPSTGAAYRILSYSANIQDVIKDDDLTVTIKTSVPVGPFLRNIAMLAIAPAGMSRAELAKAVVGTGPYRLTEYAAGSRIVMERFNDYWGPKPQVTKLTFQVIPEDTARVAQGQTGRADMVVNIPPQMVRLMAGVPGMKVVVGSTTYRMTLTYNATADTPVRKPLVRQAINYAIDRQAMIDNLLSGFALPMRGPLLSHEIGYNPDLKDYTFDRAKAKSLLAEAGYPQGFSMVIASPQGRYLKDKEISEAIAGMLREVGINARVQVYEWGTYVDKITKGTIEEAYYIGWAAHNLDSSGAFSAHWETKAKNSFSNYINADAQAALTAALSTINESERVANYRKVLDIYLSDPPAAYLYQEMPLYALKDSVQWSPRVDQLILGDSIKRAEVK